MTKKKWVLVIVIAAVALWLAVSYFSNRAPAASTGATPKPPATAYEITQGNWQFYTDNYQSQGTSVVLADFYALVDGKWKRQTTPTILNEKNGEIKIRRVQP